MEWIFMSPFSIEWKMSRASLPNVLAVLVPILPLVFSGGAGAQESDLTQTPNTVGAGIHKSLEEQIGAGRGDWSTPDSSRFLIARDPFRAIVRGRQLFQRKFTQAQGVGPRTGDGEGDIESEASIVAGLADSCAACHGRPRGSAGSGGDVFTRPDSRDAPHLFGLGVQEMLADEITGDLRAIRDSALQRAARRGAPVRVRLRSKGIDYGWLTARPDGNVDDTEVEGVDADDLRVKPFFAEGSAFSIRQFVVGALNNEMGLEAVDPDLLAASEGARVVTPAGMVLDGTFDPLKPPPAASASEDGDGDGVTGEIDPALVDFLEFYLLNYFRPGRYEPYPAESRKGRRVFERIGCAACHVPNLEIREDRRVADVETEYDPEHGGFNGLFATAATRLQVVEDGGGLPPLRRASKRRFRVQGIFTDFKRHDLGPNFWERNFDGTLQREFMTEPLWGVATTAPYGHDGRSINLREAILRHGGEAQEASDSFAALSDDGQRQILEFLASLVLFPPPDTASDLDPGDPDERDFPQFGHGRIALDELFHDPNDKE
jgi:Di-haem oxidoreductase, putative peroxidase